LVDFPPAHLFTLLVLFEPLSRFFFFSNLRCDEPPTLYIETTSPMALLRHCGSQMISSLFIAARFFLISDASPRISKTPLCVVSLFSHANCLLAIFSSALLTFFLFPAILLALAKGFAGQRTEILRFYPNNPPSSPSAFEPVRFLR